MNRQLVLDARRIETIDGEFRPEGALPPEILQLGRVPNQSCLQPGDLILTCPADKFHLVPAGITFVQKSGGYAHDHARWSHAAVYLGELFLICEATRKGVNVASLLDYLPGHTIRVRRGFRDGRLLDREAGWRIALGAMARLREGYDYGHAAEIGRRAISAEGLHGFRMDGPKSAGDDESVICSELYQDAFWWATSTLLQSRQSREATPAFLSSTTLLADVSCGWLRLA